MDFSNFVEPLQLMLLFTLYKTLWLTAICRHCPVALPATMSACRSTVTCGKTPTTVTWSKPSKICYVLVLHIKTNNRWVRTKASLATFVGKGADAVYHCMTPEQW